MKGQTQEREAMVRLVHEFSPVVSSAQGDVYTIRAYATKATFLAEAGRLDDSIAAFS